MSKSEYVPLPRQGQIRVHHRLVIVSMFKKNGERLTSELCRIIGKAIGWNPNYLRTVRSRKWFKEYCQIWDTLKDNPDLFSNLMEGTKEEPDGTQ